MQIYVWSLTSGPVDVLVQMSRPPQGWHSTVPVFLEMRVLPLSAAARPARYWDQLLLRHARKSCPSTGTLVKNQQKNINCNRKYEKYYTNWVIYTLQQTAHQKTGWKCSQDEGRNAHRTSVQNHFKEWPLGRTKVERILKWNIVTGMKCKQRFSAESSWGVATWKNKCWENNDVGYFNILSWWEKQIDLAEKSVQWQVLVLSVLNPNVQLAEKMIRTSNGARTVSLTILYSWFHAS